ASLDQDGQVDEVPPIPARKWLEELEPFARRGHQDVDAVAVGGRRLLPFPSPDQAPGGQFLGLPRPESERTAVPPGKGSADGIELERAGERQRRHDLRAGEEGQGGGAAVIAPWEVAVERGNDGVRLLAPHVGALPLPDAWPARVREH